MTLAIVLAHLKQVLLPLEEDHCWLHLYDWWLLKTMLCWGISFSVSSDSLLLPNHELEWCTLTTRIVDKHCKSWRRYQDLCVWVKIKLIGFLISPCPQWLSSFKLPEQPASPQISCNPCYPGNPLRRTRHTLACGKGASLPELVGNHMEKSSLMNHLIILP